jgi:hypothetical protein
MEGQNTSSGLAMNYAYGTVHIDGRAGTYSTGIYERNSAMSLKTY